MAKRKQPRTKRKTTTKKKNFNTKLKTINLVLAISIITLLITTLSYFFLLKEEKASPSKISQVEIKKDFNLNTYTDKKIDEYFANDLQKEKFEEYTEELDKEYIHPKEKTKPIIKKDTTSKTKEESVFDKVPTVQKQKPAIINEKNTRPKLAIVIDDVTNRFQVKKILDTKLNITMSFLPPTKQHLNSAKIAQNLPFYMIHFPMQAISFKFEEIDTLHVGDSYERIDKKVKQLRKLYPDATFTNNHTGSKFTANKEGMEHFIKALKKYDFIFVDSRTTSKTVAKEITKKYNMPYLARNIFIDNKKDFNYIQNQLKKAIRLAKKNGSSMAIGHPYDITIDVIKKSKHLFKGLDLIYVKDLPQATK